MGARSAMKLKCNMNNYRPAKKRKAIVVLIQKTKPIGGKQQKTSDATSEQTASPLPHRKTADAENTMSQKGPGTDTPKSAVPPTQRPEYTRTAMRIPRKTPIAGKSSPLTETAKKTAPAKKSQTMASPVGKPAIAISNTGDGDICEE